MTARLAMKLARVGTGLALLAALFYFRLVDLNALREVTRYPATLALALFACVAAIPVAGLRWHLLLRAQGLTLHPLHTIRISAIALFFGTVLPGGAGGDIVRGVYVYQVASERRAGALLSIFVDRLAGLSAFLLAAAAATLTRPWQNYGVFEYSILVMAVAFLVAIAVLLRFSKRIAEAIKSVAPAKLHRMVQLLEDSGAALHLYSKDLRTVAMCIGLSAAIVGLLSTAVIIVASPMKIGSLTDVEYGIAGLYAMVANALPFTPGGLGVGESAFASACKALEFAPTEAAYGTIFLAFRCVNVLSTFPGLLLYLLYPQRMRLLTPESSSTSALNSQSARQGPATRDCR